MDIYDHIEESALSPSDDKPSTNSTDPSSQPPNLLRNDLESAIRTVQSSQWGSTLNSWFSTARQQGTSFYADLQKEATEAQEQATKGFSSLKDQVAQRTRGLSLNAQPAPEGAVPGEEGVPLVKVASGAEESAAAEAQALEKEGESLPADIVKEAGTLVASLRSTAASRLKDLQKAEDAADEALLKFGTNVRNFLRDAVTISAPEEGEKGDDGVKKEVLFETSEPGTGKKIFHSTRLDAQLHAIHTTPASFTQDPAEGEQWEQRKEGFDIEMKTEEVARDLERYEELRRAMEKLVPEMVDYKTFWMRYYFLRSAVEEEERRRREVLKGAAQEEEVAWDDEDEDEPADASTTPSAVKSNHAASASTSTLTQPANDSLRPASPRRSHEDAKSVADSDASYDIVSGATSRAMGSPKEEKKEAVKGADESDDDDWE
ncbi:uncharacterized protein LTR77_007683 [Saxophila tyrrhenica]|uniref:BSD domain-containing protein n=1 Tax=Saxophila tyrrhenica TaxID=1690608 RepID=A0AAV9P2R6_9PEZI|nr:hypothetical protein LTR77_007683 [Saxophila tyrrhenica]